MVAQSWDKARRLAAIKPPHTYRRGEHPSELHVTMSRKETIYRFRIQSFASTSIDRHHFRLARDIAKLTNTS